MGDIQLYSECLSSDTIVPNKFIDQYMPDANGEFVKVYLYLLRCLHSHTGDCTVSAIADRVNHTENDVVRALNYWEKQGLLALVRDTGSSIRQIHFLSLEKGEKGAAANRDTVSGTAYSQGLEPNAGACQNAALSPSAREEPATQPPAAPALDAVPPAQVSAPSEKKTHTVSRRKDYTLDEISRFRKDPDISELFFVVETYMKHPLTQNDTNTLLYWHEELHFSAELIVYLLEYCISKGHSSMRYLDKVALGWHEKGIATVEQAKEDAAIHSKAYYGVMKALGITGRNLAESEASYIKKWTKEFGFDLSLIQEACGRTIAATHQPSFEYTDSILTSWHKNQVHTKADVEKLDSARSKTRKASARTADVPLKKNTFTNFNQRSYDYDKLEELLLTTTLQ